MRVKMCSIHVEDPASAFAFYVGTGQPRFRAYGLQALKWALIAGFGFFSVLILERIA